MNRPSRTAPIIPLLLLAGIAATASAQAAQFIENSAFRVGIRLVRSCELRADAGPAATVNCTRPVTHRVVPSLAASSPPSRLQELTPPSPQRVDASDAGSAEPRFTTVVF